MEILIRNDVDDEPTMRYLSTLRWGWLKVIPGPQPRSISQVQNELFKEANKKSTHVWLLNDDAEIITPGWMDRIEALSPWKMGLPSPRADWQEAGDENYYSEFPVIPRKGAEALGWMMPKEYPAWFAEVYTFKVYTYACLTTDLRDIKVRHRKVNDDTRHAMHVRNVGKYRSPMQDSQRLILRKKEDCGK